MARDTLTVSSPAAELGAARGFGPQEQGVRGAEAGASQAAGEKADKDPCPFGAYPQWPLLGGQ